MRTGRTLTKSVVFAIVLATGCGSRSGLLVPESGDFCTDVDAGATRACFSVCGSGVETCSGSVWTGCTAPKPRTPELNGTVRDFHDTHPDFEQAIGDDHGIVASELGSDGKPVYVSTGVTPTTHGKTFFDQWYRDVPGVNLSVERSFKLTPSGSGTYVYDDPTFFPIDDELFGNEGRPHNFHFTFEVATAFRYQGGEVFSFRGDDDLWVFLNRRLALDLGGVHAAESASVNLDQRAAELGLVIGQTHSLHLFFAERHTFESQFRVTTSIEQFQLCD